MSKGQKRLGRSLSTMIAPDLGAKPPGDGVFPVSAVPFDTVRGLAPSQRLVTIPVENIRPNPTQPRRNFDESKLASLANSLKERGTLQPVVVRPAEGGYELVAGERRLRAAKLAGVTELPAIVRSATEHEMLELALVENTQRTDLNPIEQARAYRMLNETYGLSHEAIAEKMGDDRATVTNYLRLLSLPEEVIAMLEAGLLGIGHGKAILSVQDYTTQVELAHRTTKEGWSVRQLEVAARRAASPGGNTAGHERQVRATIKDLEERLCRTTGSRVHIHEGRRRHTGRIVIHFFSLDDFERIGAMLGLGEDEG
jgi:ParB family chromosome partitioning protein